MTVGRVVTPRTPAQERRLEAIRAARAALTEADAAYRAAVLAGDADELTLTAMAEAADVSTESMRRYVARHREKA